MPLFWCNCNNSFKVFFYPLTYMYDGWSSILWNPHTSREKKGPGPCSFFLHSNAHVHCAGNSNTALFIWMALCCVLYKAGGQEHCNAVNNYEGAAALNQCVRIGQGLSSQTPHFRKLWHILVMGYYFSWWKNTGEKTLKWVVNSLYAHCSKCCKRTWEDCCMVF